MNSGKFARICSNRILIHSLEQEQGKKKPGTLDTEECKGKSKGVGVTFLLTFPAFVHH